MGAFEGDSDTRPSQDSRVGRGAELLQHAGPGVGGARTGRAFSELGHHEQPLRESTEGDAPERHLQKVTLVALRGSNKERGWRRPETLKRPRRSIERHWGVQSKMRIFT